MNDKTKNIIAWIIAALLGIQMALAGATKFFPNEEMLATWTRWGYAPTFMKVIAVLEILGAIGLLIPKTRVYAAMGLILVMLGATFTHISASENPAMPLIMIGFFGLLIFMRKSELPFGKAEA